jgi:hypothetical protein
MFGGRLSSGLPCFVPCVDHANTSASTQAAKIRMGPDSTESVSWCQEPASAICHRDHDFVGTLEERKRAER